jgi:signal transduction histidine kinase
MATTTQDPRTVKQLQHFLSWMLTATVFTVGFQIFLMLFFISGLTSIFLAGSVMQGLAIFWARRLAQKNHPSLAVAVVALGLWAICLLAAYLCPSLFPILVALIVLSLVMGLPYLSQKQLSQLMIGAIFVALITSLLSLQQNPWQIPFPDWLIALIKLLFVPLTVSLIAFLIWQYNQSLNHLLHQVEKDNSALQASQQLLEKQVIEIHQVAEIAKNQTQELESTILQLQSTQAHLVQSEKMSSLGQLVAGVAHEINNPVNFIYGNLDHAQDYARDMLQLIQLYVEAMPNPPAEIVYHQQITEIEYLIDDLPKLLSSMKVGAERIREIVLSLRNFSRLDEADMKAVDIHSGIESTLMILQHRLKSKPNTPDISVIKEYGILPLVECFPGQLNQVFMNLIVNAIDSLESRFAISLEAIPQPSEPPFIWIRTQLEEPLDSAVKKVLISISDNGIGIPEAIQAKIFDPFFTTKPVGKGTGLGLAICHSIIVEKHEGNITCNSIPGQGTEFTIEITVN